MSEESAPVLNLEAMRKLIASVSKLKTKGQRCAKVLAEISEFQRGGTVNRLAIDLLYQEYGAYIDRLNAKERKRKRSKGRLKRSVLRSIGKQLREVLEEADPGNHSRFAPLLEKLNAA